jgi:hypothetical protein
MKRFTVVLLSVGVLVLSLSAQGSASVVVNGDFSSGLTGWTSTGPVSDGGGFAVLFDDLSSFQATLEQQIVIPAGAQSLKFTYNLGYTPDGTSGSPLPDAFTASLLDLFNNPILSTTGFTDYFYHDLDGIIDYDPSIVSKSAGTVTLDLSSVPGGTTVRIVFDLYTGDDGRTTQANVDDVVVDAGSSTVPEPASVVVWLVLGIGGLFRARRWLAT